MSQEPHTHRHNNESMLNVEEALDRILKHFQMLEPEEKSILEALGQVLSEEIISPYDIPPLDNSAMDGYAIQSDSVVRASKASPTSLRVIGSVAAGELPKHVVTSGTAVRIMTGAPIPSGADAVVPFEDTDEIARLKSGREMSTISIHMSAPKGAEIRPKGQDIKRGQIVLEKGVVLRPPEIGVLASLGLSTTKVIRRPVVAILATGNELLDPSENYRAGKIFNSNNYSIAASVLRYGGVPKLLGIAKDDIESLNVKLQEGMKSDILITSAGVSKGDYDMVKDVLTQHGRIEFWSVRMRPGKPLAFGVLTASDGRQVPHLGLPGNPVSALVVFEQFGRAAIKLMLGESNVEKPTVQAVLEEPIINSDGRRVYARVTVTKRNGTYYARLTGSQGSNILTSMTTANGLAICPEGISRKDAGEIVETQMLDWPEEVF